MRRKLPPMNAVIAFEAASRHLNFTKAARELGVEQPAVTRHITNLESWLDAKLFQRNGNVIRLTLVGEAFAELATSSLDRLELGMRALPRARGDQIVLGASFGIMHLWLMPRLAAMRAATSATVNFITADDYRQFDDLAVDASIRFGAGRFHGHEADLLFSEECYVIASPQFLKENPTLDPNDFPGTLRKDWLLNHGDPHRIGWMDWRLWKKIRQAKFDVDAPLNEVRNYPAMLDMVCHGEGLAIGSLGLEDANVQSGDVIRIGPPISREGFGYYLVYRRETMQRKGFQALRDLLTGAA